MLSTARIRGSSPRAGVRRRRVRWAPVVGAAVAMCVGAVAAPAAHAAPANDDFEAATTVSALPFSDVADMAGSSIQPDEPRFCNFVENSAWYKITPTADGIMKASATASMSSSQLVVYRQDGSGLSGLSFLTCTNYGPDPAVVEVQAGTTYYVQGSTLYFPGGELSVSLAEATAPANDHFADATAIDSVPFEDRPDLTVASAEEGEPYTCVGADQKTVWYAFTPSETNSYVVDRSAGFVPVAVHRGTSLASLEEIACGGPSNAVFRGEAGTTYYLQLAAGFPPSAAVTLSVRVAPPATASFFSYPSDPSSFDTVQFYDSSWNIGSIASRMWGFGDGATATDCCPSHRYSADGEYDARLSITTSDGRSASTTQRIAVKTHDVSIATMSVPATARVGQTRELSVGVANTRYAEVVRVVLLRSIAGAGFEPVGEVTQGVPARGRKRTTAFSIAYTISPDDAAVGKVTFQAIATLVGARDAHPADNTVIAVPTKIRR